MENQRWMLICFFNRIRKELIELIKRELKTRTSARIQMTVWIKFIRDDEEGQERVGLAFKSLITSVYRGSKMDQIVDRMIANMKFQIENPALLNSRFVFDEFLYLDVNFHQLNLMRGSSYLPLPDWLARKKAIVNPHNDDEECFKWLVITAENVGMKDPQRVSNLRKFTDNYDVIKSLSRLLKSSNTKHKCKKHFCMNCFQGFMQESSRDQHQVYCEDNESVRVEMPKQGSTVEFKDGQNQFKVPFIMYADFELILELMGPQGLGLPNPNQP